MPNSTPIYGFPYPCPGEIVASTAFTDLANAIDAKMLEVSADMAFALNRPNIDVSDGSSQVIPAGVDAILTLPSSTYTVTVAGVWVFWIQVSSIGSPATITAQQVRVRQNGLTRYGFTLDSDNNNTITVRATGPIVAAVGDVISSTFLFTGTGNNTVQTRLSAKLLCRIP